MEMALFILSSSVSCFNHNQKPGACFVFYKTGIGSSFTPGIFSYYL
jgi:hypothetical protein